MPDSGHNRVIIKDPASGKRLHFSNPVEVISTSNPGQVTAALEQLEGRLSEGRLYAAGFLSYEASSGLDQVLKSHPSDDFPLVWFGLYEDYQELDQLEAPTTRCEVGPWEPREMDGDSYGTAIDRIKAYLKAGDTYQVNYTYRLQASFSGDPEALFYQMENAQQAAHGAFVDLDRYAICSASPERFFSRRDGLITTQPMKGTVERGLSLEEDRAKAEWLQASAKNRAENVMIVDMIRNDLGRIAKPGSIRVPQLFSVERYPTVWQMTSTVEAESRTGLADTLKALFPCASITGAPKVRTMEIIHELESTPRRIYTGSIGFITPDNRMEFNVAIRTALIDREAGVAEYGVGGGIVWDSSAEEEFEETQLKARVLTASQPQFELLETMLWIPHGGWFLIERHIDRLLSSAEYFAIPLDRSALEVAIGRFEESVLRDAFNKPGVRIKVRLLVDSSGHWQLEADELPTLSEAAPVCVKVAAEPVDSSNRFLYHKTTQRQVYQQAAASAGECGDVILWNQNREVTETTIANLVVQIGDCLYTPPVSCGLLNGIFRQYLLDQGEISERIITLSELSQAKAIYRINSVRKWQRLVLQA